jgi:phosphosulfolactate phosphohydrolase-like enzyme
MIRRQLQTIGTVVTFFSLGNDPVSYTYYNNDSVGNSKTNGSRIVE